MPQNKSHEGFLFFNSICSKQCANRHKQTTQISDKECNYDHNREIHQLRTLMQNNFKMVFLTIQQKRHLK